MAKLHFFMAISRGFTPFLTKYQTDQPMIPFLGQDLASLVKSMLKRFIKKEEVPSGRERISQFDVTDKKKWVLHSHVDTGMGAESILKALRASNTVSQLAVREFNDDCIKGLSAMCKKMLEKSPLKYPLVRQLVCLDPKTMHQDADICVRNMKKIVQTLINNKQLAGGVSAGDTVVQQFSSFLETEAKDSSFESFTVAESRVDTFLHDEMQKSNYAELWSTTKTLLLLSHGQATVERGFSINKEVEICNMQEDTVVAHRLVCDYITVCGGHWGSIQSSHYQGALQLCKFC